MKFAIPLLLSCLCAFGQAVPIKVSREKASLVVSVPLTSREMEVVITDTRGNVVQEAIGGESRSGKLLMRFPAPGPGDYEVCVRLDPFNPSTGPLAQCVPVRLTRGRVTIRVQAKPKPAKQATLAQRKRFSAKLATVKPPPMP